MEWYVKVLKNYFVFSGRARRKEYWMFALINLVISIVLSLVDTGIGTLNEATGYGLLSGIYTLAFSFQVLLYLFVDYTTLITLVGGYFLH
jgi:uncharacterized membrane protein YhaH (DUF805 family)